MEGYCGCCVVVVIGAGVWLAGDIGWGEAVVHTCVYILP